MTWEGYEVETGSCNGYEYGIVFPEEMAQGRPYIWRTEFFGAFPSVDLAMLKEGWAIVYYRISDLFGSPEAVGLMGAFQPFIQEKYSLSSRAVLFGFSRGGLYALHYGAKYPERIAALYLDAPVVDIYSWPGGAFAGEGDTAEWERCRKLWNLSREAYMARVDAAVRTLLAWQVPLIIVAGGKDEVVPWHENGILLQKAYEQSGTAFQLMMKPECGHHPHSLEEPSPVKEFLLKNRSYPAWGNAFRINDQSKTEYPLTLVIHDREHLELVTKAEEIFSGKYPLGYVGTSPWPGTVTNQRTMPYTESQNRALYDLLREQMEIGMVVYALESSRDEDDAAAMVRDMKEKCPGAGHYWVCRKGEEISRPAEEMLTEYGIALAEYEGEDGLARWLKGLAEEVEKLRTGEDFLVGGMASEIWRSTGNGQSPSTNSLTEVTALAAGDRMEGGQPLSADCPERDTASEACGSAGNGQEPSTNSLEREWAEWTNLSVTLPAEEEDNRILLVGDSISAGYGDMVQKRMPGWHVDRLNTSEGIHHPNFLRLLRIALGRYPYRIVHINNGIHLHGQSVEEYGRNLSGVFDGIRRMAPRAGIIFAATTPVSRRLSGEEPEGYDGAHFSMGDRAPLARDAARGEYWIIDEEASGIYRELNERAKAVCAARGIPVNDLYRLCVEENLQKTDGVHFQEEAYRRLAERVVQALEEFWRRK